ncbi:MAG: hypothetical protein JNK21_05900 [Rhodospirillaceae bacterium]|nr:hypothetical protein [Rhodospirillaceae bacterium]
MSRFRVLIAALLLVWSPLSGALANSIGANLSHHHCDNVWHNHADTAGVVTAGEDCATRSVNLDAWLCDDCQFFVAGLPSLQLNLERVDPPRFFTPQTAQAQNTVVFALFRPPKA